MTKRILIVEDVLINRATLVEILSQEGFTLLEASEAGAALSVLHDEPVDLILLDVMLPGAMDGFALCRWIKNESEYADLPVIFITGLDDTPSKVKGLELGAADYVTKPFKREEVIARVRTHLRVRDLTRSLSGANRDLVAKQAQLEEDLRSAAFVQQTFLPDQRVPVPGFEMKWRFTPSRQIGGDIFNVREIGRGWWAAYLVDVSGHGVPPALVTVALSQAILQELTEFTESNQSEPSPSAVIRALEAQFPMERFKRYFTIVMAMIEPGSGRFVYASAGHPPPLLVRNGEVELLERGGPPVGMGLAAGTDAEAITLRDGDRLYLYTDGLIEQFDESRSPFGLDALKDVVAAAHHKPLEEACNALFDALDQFRGEAEIDDDLALLILERRITSPKN